MKDERCSQCQHCQQDSYVAERLTIWKTAHAALNNEDWPEDTHQVDVLHLAKFLAGDDTETVG